MTTHPTGDAVTEPREVARTLVKVGDGLGVTFVWTEAFPPTPENVQKVADRIHELFEAYPWVTGDGTAP